MNRGILQGLDLPPVVANRTLPLDEQMRMREQADVARNVHGTVNGSMGRGTASALASSVHQAVDLRDHYSAMYWAVIAPINNVAVMEIKTAYDLLVKTKYFKQNVKRMAKLTMERCEKYDEAIIRTMKQNVNGDRSQYWMDYTDEHLEAIKHDIDMFYLSVLQVLTKYEEKDREMKARLVTSHALINYAVGMYDAYFEKVQESYHIAIERYFHDARLGYVQSPWCDVVDTICVTNKPMDVNGDKNVKLAFEIIERHILDLDRICGIGNVAISYNPDIRNEVYKNPVNTEARFNESFNECFNTHKCL